MLKKVRSFVFLLIFIIYSSKFAEAKVYSCDSRVGCGCSRNNANINARIVGGEVAATGSWGWAVSLRDASGSKFCGGSILSPSYILTAAHCLEDLYFSISRYSVEVGTNLIQQNLGQVIPFSSITMHPSYNSYTKENDIAIIRLSRPITFTDPNVARLCLPDVDINSQSQYPLIGKPLVAIGWGTLSSGGVSTYTLRQVTLYTVDSGQSKCSGSIHNSRLQFCAAVDGGGKDTCQGDSGGPIMFYSQKDQAWVLAGITSYGKGCGLSNHAGVYTRVSPYIQWIRSITGSDGFMTITQSSSDQSSSGCKWSTSILSTMSAVLCSFMIIFHFNQ